MTMLASLIRFIVLGVIVGGLIGIGLIFFSIVSVVLLAFGSIAWLKKNEVLRTEDSPVVAPPTGADVVVERKVIDAQYEEVLRD